MCRSKKLISGLLIALYILIGVTGCMPKDNSSKDLMMSYIREKYDDKFEYVSSFGGSIDGKSQQILVSAKGIPDKEITVGYYKTDSGDYFTDNYTHYRYAEQTEKFFTDVFKDALYTDVIVTYGISSTGVSNNFSSKTSFDEFISSAQSELFVTVMVSPSYELANNEKVTEDKIVQAIEAEKICCDIELYFITDEENYVPFDVVSVYALDNEEHLQIKTDEQGLLIKCEWR